MALHLYDSAEHRVRPFTPLHPGRVGMYVCGATVQGVPHAGHLRTALAFDVVRRWLERSGYAVTHVSNVTDIDDKILAKAAEAGREWWAHAFYYEQKFNEAYEALGILPPTYQPRATGHVTEMVDLMERLIERGHAYTGEPGNVYFDVPSFPGYGALTNQGTGDSAFDDDDPASDKRHPRDFALWKANKPGEPTTASWPTPWGAGRPGWHLECSAMARRYLGDEFDIHGGGLDLRFPHHENEQAQSRAAGLGFVRYWLHSAWVVQAGEKMSKSLGNFLSAEEILERHPAAVVRLALVAAHYRSMVEFSDTSVGEAAANWERFTGFADRAAEAVGPGVPGGDAAALAEVELPGAFVAAMDDDLGTPQALAAVHEEVRLGNIALAEGQVEEVAARLAAVRAMLTVLGLDPLDPRWRGKESGGAEDAALAHLVEALINQRLEARAAKDWTEADAIRDRLAAAGVVVEDGASGARWHLREN